MGRIALLFFVLLCADFSVCVETVQAGDLSERICDILKSEVTRFEKKRVFCASEVLSNPPALFRLYTRRKCDPVWLNEEGLSPQAKALIEIVLSSDLEGLRPGDYHLGTIERLLGEINEDSIKNGTIDAGRLADFDLLLSDAFLCYGTDLLKGSLHDETFRSRWHFRSRKVDLVEILENPLDKAQIERSLKNLSPQHAGYTKLKEALSRYLEIMKGGGWPAIARGADMEKGDRGPRVAALRSRLAISGDLERPAEKDRCVFDEALKRSVRSFQKRHGLDVDGIVGPSTLAALNVPVEQRIKQIKLNMERWRWLPRDLGQRYIFVNVPSFELTVVEKDEAVMRMRAVVGRKSRPTPVFTGNMKYVQLNPFWHVPLRIAKLDILPRIKEDPHYLAKERFSIIDNSIANLEELDPKEIDWSEVTDEGFSLKLRQDPGPSNALGRVKFIFPNEFQVYLHDTPARHLFEKRKRASSSGCIRIENPIGLLQYLLQDDQNWSREKIREAIDSGKTRTVRIPGIPVHVVYFTSWVQEDGTIEFREDIYGRDRSLAMALDERALRTAGQKGAPDRYAVPLMTPDSMRARMDEVVKAKEM